MSKKIVLETDDLIIKTSDNNEISLLNGLGSSTPPSNPVANMIWFDTSTKLIKYYDGTDWVPFGSAYL